MTRLTCRELIRLGTTTHTDVERTKLLNMLLWVVVFACFLLILATTHSGWLATTSPRSIALICKLYILVLLNKNIFDQIQTSCSSGSASWEEKKKKRKRSRCNIEYEFSCTCRPKKWTCKLGEKNRNWALQLSTFVDSLTRGVQ